MSKLAHLAEILIILQYKNFVTASELSEILGVDKKTIYRYIGALISANIPIETRKGRNGGFCLDSKFFMKNPCLNIEELEALLLAAEILTRKNGFAYEQQLKSAVTKIRNISDLDIDSKFQTNFSRSLEDLDDKISRTVYSIETGRAIELKYLPESGDKIIKTTIDPYNVLYKDGVWYIIGLQHGSNLIKSFALNRIDKVNVTRLIFIRPADFSLSEFIKNSWGTFSGTSTKVVIRFKENVKSVIIGSIWHPNQQIEYLEDESIILTLYLDKLSDIKSWVMGFGASAEVIEPLILRDEIKDEIDKLKGLYSA